jgi:hypothetical protein
MTELRHLEVGATKLTAAGILRLGELKQLESLGVTVDEDQLEEIDKRLNEMLPNCYVSCFPSED